MVALLLESQSFFRPHAPAGAAEATPLVQLESLLLTPHDSAISLAHKRESNGFRTEGRSMKPGT